MPPRRCSSFSTFAIGLSPSFFLRFASGSSQSSSSPPSTPDRRSSSPTVPMGRFGFGGSSRCSSSSGCC
uniref:Putative secreted protein n=1 Tax=Anopheles darlingi TaxID=43151 RepID=A0A2M4DMG0_ANODA